MTANEIKAYIRAAGPPPKRRTASQDFMSRRNLAAARAAEHTDPACRCVRCVAARARALLGPGGKCACVACQGKWQGGAE